MPFPDQLRIAGLGKPLRRVDERRVPRPRIRACDPHTSRREIECRLAPHAAARRHEIWLAIAGARGRVDDHDVERFQHCRSAFITRFYCSRGYGDDLKFIHQRFQDKIDLEFCSRKCHLLRGILKPDLGTNPKCFYLGLDLEVK